MGAFTGLKDARRGFNSNKLRAGEYLVRIDKCEFFDTKMSGEKWKNTLTVVGTISGDHKVGEVAHVIFSMANGQMVFQSNLKGFLAGVLGVSDEEIDEPSATIARSEDSPLYGMVTRVIATQRTSRDKKDKDGNPTTYVVYNWSPAFTPEEITSAIGDEAVKRFFPNGL